MRRHPVLDVELLLRAEREALVGGLRRLQRYDEASLAEAAEALRLRYDQEWSLAEIAAQLQLGPAYVCRGEDVFQSHLAHNTIFSSSPHNASLAHI